MRAYRAALIALVAMAPACDDDNVGPPPPTDGWEEMGSGTRRALNAIWAAAPDDVFAVGADGTILRFDGDDWDPMFSGTNVDLHGVWGTSSDNVIATGDDGTILLFDGGSTWSSGPNAIDDPIGRVHGVDASHIVAVGGGPPGSFLQFDGVGWTVRSTGESQTLLDVVVFPRGNGSVLVGEGGAMYVAGPDTVVAVVTGTTSNLNAVLGTSDEDIMALGDDGTVLAVDLTFFPPAVREISGPSVDWVGMATRAYNDMFLIGGDGSIFAFDRCSAQVSKGSGELLNDIEAISSQRIIAVGDNGTILTYSQPGPVGCPDQVSVTVSAGLTPTISWTPACPVYAVFVEYGAADRWLIAGDGNTIRPGVIYGQDHDCALEFFYDGPLQAGVTYEVFLYRFDGPNDYTTIATKEFTP